MAFWKKDEPKKTADLVKPLGTAMPSNTMPPLNGGTPAFAPTPTAAAAPPQQKPFSTDAAAPGQPELTPEQRQKRAAASKMVAAAFGEIVTVFMRSEHHRHYTLQDLEWLVAPAVATGQFSLAEAQHKGHGLVAPIGAVLWASVSADVDKRLTNNIENPVKLKPNEWKSGDVLWVVEAVGEQKVVQALIKQLIEKQLAGKPVRVRARSAEGKAVVGTLKA